MLSPTSFMSSLNSHSRNHSLGPQLTPQNCFNMNSLLTLHLLDKPNIPPLQSVSSRQTVASAFLRGYSVP